MAETKLVNLKIDDREVQVPAGTLVIEATRRMGIEVPSFCYYPGLTLQAACRMCLVEVEKAPKLQTACTLAVAEGMVVRTNSEPVRDARKSREPCDPPQRIALLPAHDGERRPVVGHDCMPEADARGGGDQRGGRRAHAGSDVILQVRMCRVAGNPFLAARIIT